MQYAGQYLDDESGLYWMRARYYDPTTGQFLSRDPIVSMTRDAYGYTSGEPINASDPSGLFPGSGFLQDRKDDFLRGSVVMHDALHGTGDRFATRHAIGAKQVQDFAGSTLSTMSFGHGENILRRCGHGGEVDYNSDAATVGIIAGAAVVGLAGPVGGARAVQGVGATAFAGGVADAMSACKTAPTVKCAAESVEGLGGAALGGVAAAAGAGWANVASSLWSGVEIPIEGGVPSGIRWGRFSR
jgi:RHS repeat-associated protein